MSGKFGIIESMKFRSRGAVIEKGIILILAVTVPIFNLYQVFYFFLKRPPGTVFIGITHWYEDYFYYLSQLTQGAHGAWLTRNMFTTEDIPPTVTWMFNVILGKVGAVLMLPPWTTYAGALFVISIGYVLLLAATAKLLFPKQRILRVTTLLLALISNSFFRIDTTGGGIRFVPFEYFYNYTKAFNRFGGVAHLLFQNVLSLSLIVLSAKLIDTMLRSDRFTKQAWGLILACAVLVIILFIINPVYVFVDGLVIGLVVLFYILRAGKIRSHLSRLVAFGAIFTAVLPLALIQFRTFAHPFYRYFRTWEASIPTTDPITFMLATGMISLLVPFGILPYLEKASPLRLLGFVFAFLPIVLYFSPIPGLLQIPSFRILQPPAYIFLSAIGVEGLLLIARVPQSVMRLHITLWLFPVIATLTILYQVPLLWQEIQNKRYDVVLFSSLNYVDRSIYDGLTFVAAKRDNGVVLATGNLELFVPVMTNHTVFSGHRSLTWYYNEKTAQVTSFYTRRMTPDEARSFLKENAIRYVLWQKTLGTATMISSRYPFIKEIFSNDALVVFEVD